MQEVDPQKTATMSCPMPDQEWNGRLPEKKEAASGAVFNFVFLAKMFFSAKIYEWLQLPKKGFGVLKRDG